MFVVGIKRLAKVKTARSGNQLAAGAMGVAVIGTLLEMKTFDPGWVVVGILVGASIGAYAAIKVEMTSMPEMVAIFNGLGGAASALVPVAVYWQSYVMRPHATTAQSVAEVLGSDDALTIVLSVVIGGITFTGSVIAFLKLQGTLRKGNPILLPSRHFINLGLAGGAVVFAAFFGFVSPYIFVSTVGLLLLTAIALILGVLLVIPIGGADMPVVVSLLNSYSGLAAAMAGFVIGNPLLVVGGALVGASGLILTQIMCVAMNRSLLNVLVGGFGQQDVTAGGGGSSEYTNVKSSGPEEAAMLLDAAQSVIVVPGYGLAVAQAQHTIRELADQLKKRGMKVTYAIHPVAGRMPGHMNVLLAEADVPYEELVEMDNINSDFRNTDVVLVLGANDVVNPEALDNKTSPIYGMPILHAHEARTVFVVKRSLSPGYAGIKNPLFERDNTMMLFGDAKQIVQDLLREVKEL
ncbi:MAG: NAD(P)(+) transhydrogenase (Re/Si-specific) subunit beta [Myxococcales bacterium]|nr:NAD(P)(+) transhydrogenase (Re/Si-specific) subunit beta [Myxococcales bacterium]